ncbi:uncharacterized protein PAC_01676 [Phialocephala subalpina]|uniref:Uncharacterized protein n=1 Tax=Phialocephala subalpina TaxID=576137 RepID=A0A1L7WGA0_9HELO|nr:uncharacterized protein PAC_01676 [Phialocephala subalpina]
MDRSSLGSTADDAIERIELLPSPAAKRSSISPLPVSFTAFQDSIMASALGHLRITICGIMFLFLWPAAGDRLNTGAKRWPPGNRLLLDYIDPMQPVSLWRASRNSHWAVLGGILVSLLLRILIVLSTGLLDISPTTFRQGSINLIASTNLNHSLSDTPYTNFSNDLYKQIDTSAVFLYSSIIKNGLSFPGGTTKDQAAQNLQIPDQHDRNFSIQANVLAVRPEFDCEMGHVNYTPPVLGDDLWNNYDYDLHFTFESTVSGCTIGNNSTDPYVILYDPRWYPAPARSLAGQVFRQVTCDDWDDANNLEEAWLDPFKGEIWLVTMMDVRTTQTPTPNATAPTANVSYLCVVLSNVTSPFPNLTYANMWVSNAMQYAISAIGADGVAGNDGDQFIGLMRETVGDATALLDTNTLGQSARAVIIPRSRSTTHGQVPLCSSKRASLRSSNLCRKPIIQRRLQEITSSATSIFDDQALEASIANTCLALLLTAVLEILQHYSDLDHGLLDSGFGTLKSSILVSYLPASIISLIAILFSSVDFGMLVLAPLHSLQTSKRPGNVDLHINYLSHWPPFAMWRLWKGRHFAASLTSLAAFGGAFLTIVVSGLYSLEAFPTQQALTASRIDRFNLDWESSVTEDNGAAAAFSAIEHLNLSYPMFTYQNLVFPEITVSTLRVQLACSAVYNITIENVISSQEVPSVIGNITIPLPSTCKKGGQFGNESSILYYLTYPYPAEGDVSAGTNRTSDTTYAGDLTDLHVGPWSESFYSATDELDLDDGVGVPNNPEGCPSLAFTFGRFKYSGQPGLADMSAFVCSQTIQQVLTNTKFLFPSFEIDKSHPPFVIESLAQFLTNGSKNAITRNYRPQHNLERRYQAFINNTYTEYPFSTFFQGLLMGPNGIDKDELVGVKNQPRLLEAINEHYSYYMAQAISSNMRESLTPNSAIEDPDPSRTIGDQDTQTMYQGTLTRPGPLRIIQNKTPKSILQALLAFMTLCGLVGFFLSGKKDLLMHKPTSVTGLASLIAGSRICSEEFLPEAAE